MFFAVDENGQNIEPTSGATATCPACGEKVFARTGDINEDHWAHYDLEDCPSQRMDHSAWARDWKRHFPREWLNKPVEKDGKRLLADVAHPNGTLLRLQQYRLSPEELEEFESHFRTRNLIWLFNATDHHDHFVLKNRLQERRKLYRWKWPQKRVGYTRAPAYLDLGKRRGVLLVISMKLPVPSYITALKYSRFGVLRWFVKDGAPRGEGSRQPRKIDLWSDKTR